MKCYLAYIFYERRNQGYYRKSIGLFATAKSSRPVKRRHDHFDESKTDLIRTFNAECNFEKSGKKSSVRPQTKVD